MSLKAMGRNLEALYCFDIAVDLDPLNIVAINNKGGCLYLLGRQREAISCFSKAFEVNSSLARPKSQPVNSNTNNKKRF